MFDTRDLGRRPGAMTEVTRKVPAPVDLGTDVIGVPEGSELELELRLESVLEGVLVTGTVEATAHGDCVRCLESMDEHVSADIQELYAYPGRAYEVGEDEAVRELQDELIDLEGAVRDALVLALPYRPLCQPDCPGLCSECGVQLVQNPGHQHETIDHRWDDLKLALGEDGQASSS